MRLALEGAGLVYDIVTISDDANNQLYDIEMVDEEYSLTCMRLLKHVVDLLRKADMLTI